MNMDFVYSGIWHGMLLVVSIIMVMRFLSQTKVTDESNENSK